MSMPFARFSPHPSPFASRPPPWPHRAAVVLVVLAVIALHVLLGVWVSSHRLELSSPAPTPVEIDLIAPRPVAPPAEVKPPPPLVRRVPRHRPPPVAKPAPAPAAAEAPPLMTTDNPAAPPEATGNGTEGTAPAGAAAAGSASGPGTSAPAAPPADAATFAPPPSADLEYDLLMNGVRNETSVIRWQNDGAHYSLKVEMPIIFLGTFTYTSEGGFDDYGLAPARYVEQRGRRAAYTTTFKRDAPRQISFSRTPSVLPLPDGAQDRFSVMLELASLARGDPARYTRPGATREFYVADVDSGESWPMQYVGPDAMQTPSGYLETRHFMRLPRRAGDERKIDVWLAPSLDWMPVRIRQTEPNGTQFELIFRRKAAS